MNLLTPLPPPPRPATIADLSSLVKLEEEIFDYDQMNRSSFKKFISTSYLWVYEIDEKIVGYILVLKRKGSKKLRVYSLGVSAQCRGLGVGKKLFEFAIAEARAHSYHSMKLEVKVDNASAIKLYETLGFTQTKRIEGFYSDGTDAFVYLKLL